MTQQTIADEITRQSATSFSVSFALLPRPKRDAIRTVYAFCRQTDDIVDEGDDPALQARQLDEWTATLRRALDGPVGHPILDPMADVVHRFHIPPALPFALIDGMRMDLVQNRYATFDELRTYCWHVASTVGLMSSPIFGYVVPASLQYAETLGIALQLTNIIRDVAADAGRGRIYLPLDELRAHGLCEDDILSRRDSPELRRLMAFQVKRAWRHFDAADRLLPREDFGHFAPARIMGRVYQRLLRAIAEEDFDVVTRRIRVSSATKLLVSVAEWARPRWLARRPEMP